MSYQEPHIIDFPKLGESSIGYISVTSNDKLPFKLERLFWTYYTPDKVIRGRHAHYTTEQVLIAVSGSIAVQLEGPDGVKQEYLLDKPEIGLYIPPNCWHTMQYSHTSVQMVFASTQYEESDYIRDYKKFKEVYSK